jgi:hypothetical protein
MITALLAWDRDGCTFRLLHASVANVMSRPTYELGAFQMVLIYCGGGAGTS